MDTGATISECGTYRYLLWRVWNPEPEKRKLVFIMLNPSTAGPYNDDNTIRRCMRFAASQNYGGILVANLLAYRCTDPAELPLGSTAIGPLNDGVLNEIAKCSYDIVFAWGTKGVLQNRDKAVIDLFPNAYCLERTKEGYPKHPLYIRSTAQLIPFRL